MDNNKRSFLFSIILLLASIVILLLAGKSFLDNQNTEYRIQNTEDGRQNTEGNSSYFVAGYYAPNSDSSMQSLQKNLNSVDIVIMQSLRIGDAKGNLTEINSPNVSRALSFVRSNSKDRAWAMINNYGNAKWQGDLAEQIFADSGASSALINNLYTYVQKNNFEGISLDFESLPPQAKGDYPGFVRQLKAKFAPLPVSVHVPADDNNYDYSGLASSSDYVIVMAYDEHYSTTAPGPIASIKWFKDILQKRSDEIPANKLVVGIGNYAYDWVEGGSGAGLSTPAAIAIAKQKNITLPTDTDSLNSHFDYVDSTGKKHQVWLLDSVSAQYEVDALKSFNPAGVALFRFGSEDPFT